MTLLLDVPNEILLPLAGAIVGYIITYWTSVRRRDKAYKSDAKQTKEDFENLKSFIGKIFIAMGNSNGYGDRFKAEFAKLENQEDSLNSSLNHSKNNPKEGDQ